MTGEGAPRTSGGKKGKPSPRVDCNGAIVQIRDDVFKLCFADFLDRFGVDQDIGTQRPIKLVVCICDSTL